MARLPYLEADQVAPEYRDMLKRNTNLHKLLVNSPDMARAFSGLGGYIRHRSKLERYCQGLVPADRVAKIEELVRAHPHLDGPGLLAELTAAGIPATSRQRPSTAAGSSRRRPSRASWPSAR